MAAEGESDTVSQDSDGVSTYYHAGSVFSHELNSEIIENMAKAEDGTATIPITYGDTTNPLRDKEFNQRTKCSLGLLGAVGCTLFGIACIILTILFFALGWEKDNI